MTEDFNKKVITLFKTHKIKDNKDTIAHPIKFYAGFNYIKLRKDGNGKKFSKDILLRHAKKCQYLVSVMREIDGEIILYSYDVPGTELFKFLESFQENTLDGTIIEIEKYFSNDLA